MLLLLSPDANQHCDVALSRLCLPPVAAGGTQPLLQLVCHCCPQGGLRSALLLVIVDVIIALLSPPSPIPSICLMHTPDTPLASLCRLSPCFPLPPIAVVESSVAVLHLAVIMPPVAVLLLFISMPPIAVLPLAIVVPPVAVLPLSVIVPRCRATHCHRHHVTC